MITSLLHFWDILFTRILRQQMAQDTLLTKLRSPSECCVCREQFSPICNFRWFDCGGAQVEVKYSYFQYPRFCSPWESQVIHWIESECLHRKAASSNLFWRQDHLSYQSWAQMQKACWRDLRTQSASKNTAPDPVHSTCGPQQEVRKDQDQGETPLRD